MRNITFRADERLIEAARNRARRERTTLNEEFRRWLGAYALREQQAHTARETIADLQASLTTGGRRCTRDELNAR